MKEICSNRNLKCRGRVNPKKVRSCLDSDQLLHNIRMIIFHGIQVTNVPCHLITLVPNISWFPKWGTLFLVDWRPFLILKSDRFREPSEEVVIMLLDICVAARHRLELLVEQQVFHIFVVI